MELDFRVWARGIFKTYVVWSCSRTGCFKWRWCTGFRDSCRCWSGCGRCGKRSHKTEECSSLKVISTASKHLHNDLAKAIEALEQKNNKTEDCSSLTVISTASKHLHNDLAKAIEALEQKKHKTEDCSTNMTGVKCFKSKNRSYRLEQNWW